MNKEESLTMFSRPEEVLKWISYDILDEGNVNAFRVTRKYYEDIFEVDALRKFVQLPIVANLFQSQWLHESGSQWEKRTIDFALKETIFHALTIITGYLEVKLDDDRIGQFAGFTDEQLQVMILQSKFIDEYYRNLLDNAET